VSKDRRARATGRLGVKEGERYALIPEEVMMSAAYHALPDYAKAVLVAVASRFNGHNNANLSMSFADARKLGIAYQWKLFGGLQLLRKVGLIEMTRQGRLECGTKVCSLYAITWRRINAAPEGVSYDAGIVMRPLPGHEWAKWEPPENWSQVVRETASAMHGLKKDSRLIQSRKQLRSTTVGATEPISAQPPTINPDSTTVGADRSTTVGATEPISAQPPWEKEGSIPAPTLVDSSKTSPLFPRTTQRQTHRDRAHALQVNGSQSSNKRSRVSETPRISGADGSKSNPDSSPKSRAPKLLKKLAKAAARTTERTH
jgi:hypothetical protein